MFYQLWLKLAIKDATIVMCQAPWSWNYQPPEERIIFHHNSITPPLFWFQLRHAPVGTTRTCVRKIWHQRSALLTFKQATHFYPGKSNFLFVWVVNYNTVTKIRCPFILYEIYDYKAPKTMADFLFFLSGNLCRSLLICCQIAFALMKKGFITDGSLG